MYANFELNIPRDLKQLLAEYGKSRKNPLLVAGGTVALIDIRSGKAAPKSVISLDRVASLRGIRKSAKSLTLGARTTVSDLLQSADVAAMAPSLVESARIFAGLMVRNSATVGGNIACGSPAADLVPPLMAYDAVVELASAKRTRRVALADYYLGYKKDVRKNGELITKVILPDLDAADYSAFYKLARRKGDAITVVGVAVSVRVIDGVCKKARIALGSVSPAPMRAFRSEHLLEGKRLTAEVIETAAQAAEADCKPIDDVRASGAYRRKMVRVLVRRLLSQAAEQLS